MPVTKSKPPVIKTKNGKFAFTLDYNSIDELRTWLLSFLETESVNILSVRVERNHSRHLYYAVINSFFFRYHNKLHTYHKHEKFAITHAEAICLLVMLEGMALIELKEIRAQLHKLLS